MDEIEHQRLIKIAQEEHERDIAIAKARFKQAIDGIEWVRLHSSGRSRQGIGGSLPSEFARKLHIVSSEDAASENERNHARGELITAIRTAIIKLGGDFTIGSLMNVLSQSYPHLRATERVESIASALSRMIAGSEVEVVAEGKKGSPQIYRKAKREGV